MPNYVEIRALTDDFCRGGKRHSKENKVYKTEDFTKDQLEQIKNEPKLSVRFFKKDDEQESTIKKAAAKKKSKDKEKKKGEETENK